MNVIDEEMLTDAWEALDSIWDEFEALRHSGVSASGYVHAEEVERFVHGWQVGFFDFSIGSLAIN